ncbi:SDR family oxidoreductase [Variovorax arabinosiphilus]|uniref:SDR family oxidoreductase n=1 Tax=Variovorax arabinosiphilus TaxID=3053498 RepID=UPI0025765FB2|nr:SDR family NAD(P)-dependent oxidoreductase [Variovorax sp. J2R1-6]MDM0235367.1 SDR family NAD(P)-dependent oxidoreductase [Variovorax sp. J2R1-6]
MNTSGNTILITGATSGIGLGLALRFHAAGNKVIVAGRRKAMLQQITSDHPGIESLELDVADAHSIVAASEQIASRFPNLNVVINNAGVMLPENVRDAGSLEVAEETVTVNLLGTIRMTHAFLPQLAKVADSYIINVSSSLAFVPFPSAITYGATKAAIHSFTESLRYQLAGTSVRVIEIVPPGVRTTLFGQENDDQAMPLEDFLDESLSLLHGAPTPSEIVVERAKFLRFAEANGNYGDIFAMLSAIKAPA